MNKGQLFLLRYEPIPPNKGWHFFSFKGTLKCPKLTLTWQDLGGGLSGQQPYESPLKSPHRPPTRRPGIPRRATLAVLSANHFLATYQVPARCLQALSQILHQCARYNPQFLDRETGAHKGLGIYLFMWLLHVKADSNPVIQAPKLHGFAMPLKYTL